MDVRGIREALGLSRAEFAEKVGVTVSAVESWEYGRRNPSKQAQFIVKILVNKEKKLKLTHDQIVKTYREKGYEEVDIFPLIPVTVMSNGHQFITIKGIRVRDGYHKPKN
jgi:transcriptional regulator with XRE-family HTH domain